MHCKKYKMQWQYYKIALRSRPIFFCFVFYQQNNFYPVQRQKNSPNIPLLADLVLRWTPVSFRSGRPLSRSGPSRIIMSNSFPHVTEGYPFGWLQKVSFSYYEDTISLFVRISSESIVAFNSWLSCDREQDDINSCFKRITPVIQAIWIGNKCSETILSC